MKSDDSPAPQGLNRSAVDRDWLRRSALHYLERYATAEANLARVLRRRIARRYREMELDAGDIEAAVAEVLSLCRGYGFVDDRAFAELKVAAGRRKGLSGRKLEAVLAGKGVDRDVVAEALDGAGMDDRTAAILYARRRRLGPWQSRSGDDRERKDIAALCRAGFTYGTARDVVAMSIDEAEQALQGDGSDT